MKWEGRRESENVVDMRGRRGGVAIAGGGLGLVVLLLLSLFFGIDPRQILEQAGPEFAGPQPGEDESYQETPDEARLRQFAHVVLADTEDSWNDIFRSGGQSYSEPKLVLFSGSVQSACGFAQSAVGPFYCPADRRVYIDLAFLDRMSRTLGAGGDFAQAYVIAHEVGHHVQNLLGVMGQVDQARRTGSEAQANALSVRLELQADCLAGVWAAHTERQKQILETGDIEEALNAAAAVGDDTLQKRAQGYVVPETFTHGSSADRAKWLRRGLQSGKIESCNTFEEWPP